MKKLLPVAIIFLFLLNSCVKKDMDPGCSVKGTWMGRWSTDDQEGTWMCNAHNQGTELNGYVFILFDMPNLENHGISFDGLLRDRQVSSKVYISGASLTIHGNVDTDSTANGSFSVSIGMKGSWQGVLLPALNLSVVDSFPLNIQNPYSLNIACDTDKKHLFVINGQAVTEYNYRGGFIRSFNTEHYGSICFDGNNLWLLDNGYNKIVEVDTLGNDISEFTCSIGYSDAIMFDGRNFYISSDYSRKIYNISKSGSPLGELDFAYTYITGIVKNQDDFFAISHSFPGTILAINSSGVPEKAFKFSNGYCYGLARDGEYLWCTVVRYINTSSNPHDPPSPPTTDVKLFKLKVNS